VVQKNINEENIFMTKDHNSKLVNQLLALFDPGQIYCVFLNGSVNTARK